jgi:hypothetical protein
MYHLRQLDIVDPALLAGTHIDLIGLGGIGSSAGQVLARCGCSDMRAFDPDVVDAVNLGSQQYRVSDAANAVPKAIACREIWREATGIEVEAVVDDATRYDLRGVVIAAVDSMATRAAIWERVRDRPAVDWLIDGRMGGESGSLFAVRPMLLADARFYAASLYGDSEAAETTCTARAVAYNTAWIGSLIGRYVKRIVVGEPVERRIDFDLRSLVLVVD